MSEAQISGDIKIAGYCRTCGMGLDQANMKISNGTIYCSDHMPPDASAQQSPYTAQAAYHIGEGSPGAAFLLGMIPGVGAIYNGQYAKGILHVVILAMLITGADSGAGPGALFGLLIPGFWCYMAFEAYHTAKRRRDGLPVDEFSSLGLTEANSRFPIAPLALIGFGVIFLLDNLGLFDLRELVRFWPVGMIALGVYMLYARMKGDKHDAQ